jgi:23S rRNA-/tRNA-specific pseudouridylate synthase
VHLAELGFPLAVDPVYGRRRALSLSEFKRDYRRKPGASSTPLIDALTLHAARSTSRIPIGPGAGRRRIRVEAPLPRDLARLLKQLEKAAGLRCCER